MSFSLQPMICLFAEGILLHMAWAYHTHVMDWHVRLLALALWDNLPLCPKKVFCILRPVRIQLCSF